MCRQWRSQHMSNPANTWGPACSSPSTRQDAARPACTRTHTSHKGMRIASAPTQQPGTLARIPGEDVTSSSSLLCAATAAGAACWQNSASVVEPPPLSRSLSPSPSLGSAVAAACGRWQQHQR